MIKAFLISSCLVICAQSNLYAQLEAWYSTETIDDQSGLPENEVYDVAQAKDGYIWFATSNGLSRYNGQSHLVFNTSNGIPSAPVYHLFPQADTSMVGVCSTGEFFKIKNDQVVLLLPADTSRKYLKPRKYPYAFYTDSLKNYHIGSRLGYYCFNQKNHLIRTDSLKENKKNNLTFWINEESEVFCYTNVDTKKTLTDSVVLYYNKTRLGEFELEKLFNRSIYPSKNKNLVIIPIENTLILIDLESLKVRKFELDYPCISTNFIDNTLYVGSQNNGVYEYKIENEEIELTKHYFEGLSVSSVKGSGGHLLWFSTLEEGVKKIDLSKAEIVYKTIEGENITSFGIQDTSLIVGFESGLIHFNQEKFFKQSEAKVYDIEFFGDRTLISQNEVISFDQLGNQQLLAEEYSLNQDLTSGKLVQFNDSIMVAFGYANVSIWNQSSGEVGWLLNPISKPNGIRFSTIQKVNGLIYASTSDQIIIFDPLNPEEQQKVLTNCRLIYFFKHDNQVFGLTDNLKICLIQDNHCNYFDLPKIDGVYSSMSALYVEGVLHVGTNKGMFSWKLPDNQSQFIQLLNFEPTPQIHTIKRDKDYLYLATSKKVQRKSLSNLSVQIPQLKLDLKNEFERAIEDCRSIEFDHDRNNLEIIFSSISLGQPVLDYRYQLIGLDERIYHTNNSSVIYNGLAPGDYEFRASSTCDGFNYSKDQIITIRIQNPFWTTWWFILLTVFFSLLSIFSLTHVYFKAIKKRSETKATMTRLRSQALTSQLNPHLVFNVLNAMQGMVTANKTEEVNVYISQFSEFLRYSLNMSKVVSVPIGQEITLIKSYLELEKLRFQNSISFNLEVNLNQDDTQVPPLILQPLIENAIKHGAMPIEGDCLAINIEIFDNESFLILRVEDNGRGIEKTLTFGDGVRITSERLKTLDSSNQLELISKRNPTIIQLQLKK